MCQNKTDNLDVWYSSLRILKKNFPTADGKTFLIGHKLFGNEGIVIFTSDWKTSHESQWRVNSIFVSSSRKLKAEA